MTDSIFLVQSGTLKRMQNTPYAKEEILQQLVATFPDVLAGELVDPNEPRRWLLIGREIGVPDREEGGDRWSLDHLFVDQDGVPTLVETKRASDTRLRREVVSQMLDYAANGSTLWSIEKMIARFEARCRAESLEPTEVLTSFLGGQSNVDSFWSVVKTNLQAGRLRLLFVADEIPPPLARIIEFLNGQMDPAEVLGVELRQYLADGIQTIVPTLVGRTAIAEVRKAAAAPRSRATIDDVRKSLMATAGERIVDLAEQLVQWAEARGLHVSARSAPLSALVFRRAEERASLMSVAAHPSGTRLYLTVAGWQRLGLTKDAIDTLKASLAALPGMASPFSADPSYPWIAIDTTADPLDLSSSLSAVFDSALTD